MVGLSDGDIVGELVLDAKVGCSVVADPLVGAELGTPQAAVHPRLQLL